MQLRPDRRARELGDHLVDKRAVHDAEVPQLRLRLGENLEQRRERSGRAVVRIAEPDLEVLERGPLRIRDRCELAAAQAAALANERLQLREIELAEVAAAAATDVQELEVWQLRPREFEVAECGPA